MMKYLNITEARSRLTSIQEELSDEGGAIAITTHGKPTLALMSWDLYEAIMETMDIMSDPDLLSQVRRGIEDLGAGRVVSLKDFEEEFA